MTDEELKQWVRKQIFDIIDDLNQTISSEWASSDEERRRFTENSWELSDQILSLKKPDGTPAIGIISDDQLLPLYSNQSYNKREHYIYIQCQAQMLEAGFVRLVGGKKCA